MKNTKKKALKFQRQLGIALIVIAILIAIAFPREIDTMALSALFAPLGTYLICTKKIWVHR